MSRMHRLWPCYWQRQRFWDGYGWRDSQRAGLRLISFIFVKSSGVPENDPFSGTRSVQGLKKTAFSGHEAAAVYLGLTVVRFLSETVSSEYRV